MCGLAGIAHVDGSATSQATQGILEQMAALLAHRGPDDVRILREGRAGLAFTRLSLVDPIGGGQPLISDDGSVVVIANGEIYNHRELAAALPGSPRMRTGSDCEVLVHLYQHRGLDFLDDVRGMFALVVWDRRREVILLARDRFAIKPLYLTRNTERIAFASEIKALFADPACPRELDWDGALASPSLSGAPTFGGGPPSWFTGIEEIPAATIVEISLRDGRETRHRYWSLPEAGAEPRDLTDAEFVSTFSELLSESVGECLMADVEIGLFLSGGVDSSAVAALASRTASLHTFTVLSASTHVNGDAVAAARLAAALGIPNHQVVFGADRAPTPQGWRDLLWLVESPVCGPEQYYKFELHRYAKLAQPGLKAMLLGAAADEFNGGYSGTLAGAGSWSEFDAALDGMARDDRLRGRPGMLAWVQDWPLPLLTDAAVGLGGVRGDPYAAFVRMKAQDVQFYNCWHEDRTAGGNGIEARVPFLDHRLVELVSAIPASRRADLLWDKRILRDAVRGFLPAEITDREKVPFFAGAGVEHTYRAFVGMLAQNGGELLDAAFAADRMREFIEVDNLRATVDLMTARPGVGNPEALLRLVNLGLLDGMLADLPAPLPVVPAGVRLRALRDATPAEVAAAGAELLPVIAVDPAAVPTLHGEAMLLQRPAVPGTWYVAIGGTLEFEIDEREDPGWLRFLLGVDGQRTIGELAAAAGVPVAEIAELVSTSAEAGILELAAPVPGDAVTAAAASGPRG